MLTLCYVCQVETYSLLARNEAYNTIWKQVDETCWNIIIDVFMQSTFLTFINFRQAFYTFLGFLIFLSERTNQVRGNAAQTKDTFADQCT